VIVKHANPCGVAVGKTALDAYRKAFRTDPTSAFGGILAFNRTLERAAADAIGRQFAEVIVAPRVDAGAREAFAKRQNLRVLEAPLAHEPNALDFKRVGGGLLAQTTDAHRLAAAELKVATKKKPGKAQLADLLFAWRVAQYVKSNAIVFAKGGATVGVGAGQMSRVDSARIAAIKAKAAGLSLKGSVVASDAFFPFRDGLDAVVRAGAVAVIQPGGSVRDDEVIAAADGHRVAMVFTGVRHFRH
jgi:phosphoribosylaminoimidazolecarboxamide formyltransferase/IMP cyclohydrolase